MLNQQMLKRQPVERRETNVHGYSSRPKVIRLLARRVFDVLFDKLGWWNEIVEISRMRIRLS